MRFSLKFFANLCNFAVQLTTKFLLIAADTEDSLSDNIFLLFGYNILYALTQLLSGRFEVCVQLVSSRSVVALDDVLEFGKTMLEFTVADVVNVAK